MFNCGTEPDVQTQKSFPLSWAEGLREPRALVLRPVKGNPKFARRFVEWTLSSLRTIFDTWTPGYQP